MQSFGLLVALSSSIDGGLFLNLSFNPMSRIVARQRATARYWFELVDPLDHFTPVTTSTGTVLCFDDLALRYRLEASPAATRYRVTTYDVDARSLGPAGELAAMTMGHACTAPLALSTLLDGYTIVRVQTPRRARAGDTFVHLARDPASGLPRVIGIWRS